MAIITLTPAHITTDRHVGAENYSGFPAQLDTQGHADGTATPVGSLLVGYSHAHGGGDIPLFSPTWLHDTVFRGLVQFTLPAIAGEITKATLSFQMVESQSTIGDTATNASMSSLTNLLLATENWFGGFDHLIPGDSFLSLPFVDPQDGAWSFAAPDHSVSIQINGKAGSEGTFLLDVTDVVRDWQDGRRPNFGFVLTTNDERIDAKDNDVRISTYNDFHLQVKSIVPAPPPPELRLTACVGPQGRLHVIASTKNGTLLHNQDQNNSANPTGWLDFQPLTQKTLQTPTVVASAGGIVDLFVIDSQRHVLHDHWNGTAWSPQWTDLGGVCGVPPSVIASGGNKLDLFIAILFPPEVAAPEVSDGKPGDPVFSAIRLPSQIVMHKAFDGATWTPNWDALGGFFTYPPAAVAIGPQEIALVAVNDESLHISRLYRNGQVQPWGQTAFSDLSASVPTDLVTMVLMGANRFHLFGTEPDSAGNNTIWHKAYGVPAANMWTPSPTTTQSLGGGVQGGVQAIAAAMNHIDVFGVKDDASRHLVHKGGDGTNWSPAWDDLGKAVHSSSVPCVIANGPHAEIFLTDPARIVWHGHSTGKWDATSIQWREIGKL